MNVVKKYSWWRDFYRLLFYRMCVIYEDDKCIYIQKVHIHLNKYINILTKRKELCFLNANWWLNESNQVKPGVTLTFFRLFFKIILIVFWIKMWYLLSSHIFYYSLFIAISINSRIGFGSIGGPHSFCCSGNLVIVTFCFHTSIWNTSKWWWWVVIS